MLISLAFFALAALLAPVLARVLGPRVFWLLALVPLGALAVSVSAAPRVFEGEIVRESLIWVQHLELALSFRLDTLSWVMTIVVLGVGALVLVYCERYFAPDEPGLGRFAGFFIAFSGTMYGLVVSDDIFLLFMFWEATTVFSYLLIAHYTDRKASRGAALQALLVTTGGGLTMFVGLIVLAAAAESTSLSEIVASPPEGGAVMTAVFLILVGAVSKSALVPFHFWLPAAMAAPTPVSAYLHAAAMVKAGIYLIAALTPGFANIPGWSESLVALGVVTMLVGGWRSLRQTDIKLLLAYGTVSQLGFLTVIAGFGSRTAALAALALLLAHALFKATLFLVVGLIDHSTGTRDLRRLSGLGRQRPVLAIVATLAVASMVGLPPTFGFVAKEAVFTALLEGDALGILALLGVVTGSVFTVAYSARFLWGAFARKEGVEDTEVHRDRWDALVSPALLAAGGIGLGLVASVADPVLAGYAVAFPAGGHEYHLALWHGLEPALGLSALTLLLGTALFWKRERVARLQAMVPATVNAADGYWKVLRFIDRTAARVTSTTQRGSLPFYLGVILLVLVATAGTSLVLNETWPTSWRLWDFPSQAAVGLIMVIAAVAAVRADKRFTAVVLVGVTGYGLATLFVLQGAPDLAFTQLLVETVTLVAFVLVLRRLPRRIGVAHGRPRHRAVRAALAVVVALTMSIVAVTALAARSTEPIYPEFAELARTLGHGVNVVNVALVDVRAWDTMGELSVIIVAANGVASLVFLDRRTDDLVRPRLTRGRRGLLRQRPITEPSRPIGRSRALAETGEKRLAWLLAGRTLAPENRSILLEITVRLVFHSIMVVSLFVLFSGHNAPGGGFAAGLVAGMALVARYLAGGRYELGAAVTIDAGRLLGSGLVLAVGSAAVPLLFGADALTSAFIEGELPLFGHVEFITSTIFDVGVYLIVIGLVLDVLRSLGGEVDRQQEEEDPRTPHERLEGRADA
ncbi:Na+/H+ antiporter subunit A [Salinibacterium sp. SYSU T00001]|uniref:Na+/H+ antiporter subunit A n=1 Tax=Homoserinimonas sedimenticola TaxID=2986805 RepID=UPI0022360E72|nr:Na+/H+ antiporter subunit A [Salinibacterium sedimenticola]MCW4384957.1 Na+/H+ antiporter subunit A [Salinibacterium sedimenticola]